MSLVSQGGLDKTVFRVSLVHRVCLPLTPKCVLIFGLQENDRERKDPCGKRRSLSLTESYVRPVQVGLRELQDLRVHWDLRDHQDLEDHPAPQGQVHRVHLVFQVDQVDLETLVVMVCQERRVLLG